MFRVTPRLRFIEPQLASPVDQPPVGKHWLHEIKHDGYRCQVLLERGQARVSGDDRTQFFAELERLATSWASFKGTHDVKWCHPKLAVEVKHLAGSKMLRHASVRGLVR
jgi:hypothetical protein